MESTSLYFGYNLFYHVYRKNTTVFLKKLLVFLERVAQNTAFAL